MRNIKNNKKAVSEVVGTIMLLGMAIALFSIVQIMAMNFPFNEPDPSVRLTATIDVDTVVIVHQGGESLSLDTKIIFYIDGNSVTETAGSIIDSHTPGGSINSWDIGEKLLYDPPGYGALKNKEVRITVVDVVSNSLIMQGTVIGDD